MQFIKHFSEINENELPLVGGKGLNLGKLTKYGFAVPQGFCITTDAYRFATKDLSDQNRQTINNIKIPSDIITVIFEARDKLQTDTVAVRSSATAEDLDEASFAGQQDTFLNVSVDGLVDAVIRCWVSLWSERAIAYRRAQGITDERLAMAVVVQEMFNADVSGVLFTESPFAQSECTVESNWGLGESVVSGAITPDNFQVSRETGEVLKKNIATKQEMITRTGINQVPDDQQNLPSLTNEQLKQLCEIGIQVETLYGQPMDIEWGFLSDPDCRQQGKFVLLQARPITDHSNVHQVERSETRQKLLQKEIEILKTIAADNETVWCHHNIAEVLPAPLPMTWAVIKEFMSGSGGLGNAYRGLGFHPSQKVSREGPLDLICGRIYVNLNRETELFFDGFPLAHDFAELKSNPQKAMSAQANTDIKRSTASFWFKLPIHIFRMTNAEMKLRKCRSDFDKILTEQEFPKFHKIVQDEQNLAYAELTDAELVEKFKNWCQYTLNDFAPHALTPTLLTAFSLQRLETALQKCLNETETKSLVSRLISGQSGNLTVETNEKLKHVASGDLTLNDFLKDYGHRALDEFELAQPRWRENTTYLERIIASFSQNNIETEGRTDAENQHLTDPNYLQQKQIQQYQAAEKELTEIIKNKHGLRKQIETELEFTRRYMPFRETAKFYLMLGYEQVRRALVELDKRYQLDGGIFYLIPDELEQLINGDKFTDVIIERKKQRELLLQIELPDVIFSDALKQLGSSLQVETSGTYTGVGVSAGIGKGQARVLMKPTDIQPSERDYILVCPSTDPAWTPLFLHAAGLVMERGGLLSHGAVVAREYGIPAVVNIPNATQNITDGQMLQVDGYQGTVSIISS